MEVSKGFIKIHNTWLDFCIIGPFIKVGILKLFKSFEALERKGLGKNPAFHIRRRSNENWLPRSSLPRVCLRVSALTNSSRDVYFCLSPGCVHLLFVQAIPLIFCLYYILIVFILKTKNVGWFYSELTCRCFVAFFQLASSLISHSTFCPASRAVSVSIAGKCFYSACIEDPICSALENSTLSS